MIANTTAQCGKTALTDKLKKLRVPGIAELYTQQLAHEPDYVNMPFEDRLTELIDGCLDLRMSRQVDRLIKHAGLALPHACFEELDTSPERSLDIKVIQSLKDNDYITQAHNVIITGPTGTGKTFLSNALAVNACREGFSVRYFATADLLDKLIDLDRDSKEYTEIRRCHLLILDSFLLHDLLDGHINLLAGVVQARHRNHSTIICSHYTAPGWLERMGATPLAEVIVDRLLAGAYHLELDSPASLRAKYEALPDIDR